MNVELLPETRNEPLAKVILFFPRFSAPQYPVWMPLEVMTLSTALWNAGYQVRVIDDRMETKAEELLLEEARDALFVGFSARPGDQVLRTLELASELKRRYPQVAILMGGWFATVFTDACMDLPPVDIVVQGQADRSIVEIADRLRLQKNMEDLPGVQSRWNGAFIQNPRRPLEDINATSRIPFDRFPINEYITFDHCLSYYSSRGCPARCRFCSVPCAFPEQWSGYEADRVIDDLEQLSKGYGVKLFKIHDTDFFPDFDRVKAICRGLIERELKVNWVADCRIEEIIRFDEEMWDLLVRSGLREIVTGGEAGCDKQLELIDKRCTANQIYEAAGNVVSHGIKIRLNFIIGLHGEKRKALLSTLRLLDRLQRLGEGVKFQFYRYTPVPASELGAETWRLKARGHDGTLPCDAESILKIPLNHDQATLFWLSRTQEIRVKRLYYFYLPLAYYFHVNNLPGLKWRVLKLFKKLARLRARHGITALPFEKWLCTKLKLHLPRSREFEWKQEL
ncbi:MAG: radical SAM protein [Planctomycetota bacterium]